MAIIDLVKWTPSGNETIYAWRFPETNLSTYTEKGGTRTCHDAGNGYVQED